jgi:hypothetical protein
MGNFFQTDGDVLGQRYNEKQLNGAILPEFIYKTDAVIKINKQQLMEILEEENQIRLSTEMREQFDNNQMDKYFELDTQCINMALRSKGYNPDLDDSLKAYHISTGKYINDREVKEKVVWLKYDKAKLGKLKIGDNVITNGLFVYNKKLERIPLADLLSPDKPNIIVSGSLS